MSIKKSNPRKGIILAGGLGSRLHPLTHLISKQLLPVFNKPMIYYPLTTLMLANIKDILIISDPQNLSLIKNFLGDGNQFGIKISYAVQKKPQGIAQAFLIAEKFVKNSPVALILGDNIFFGQNFSSQLQMASNSKHSHIFLYQVSNPKRFGVAELNKKNQVIDIVEKPNKPKTNYAVTGLYFYDEKVVSLSRQLRFSKRKELEITDLNKLYIKQKKLNAHILTRGFNWYDAGNFESLLEVSNLIESLETRQNLRIGDPLEVAYRQGWISKKELLKNLQQFSNQDNLQYYQDL